MDDLTPDEVADWKRMMAQSTPTVISPETYATLQRELDADPKVIPGLADLMRETTRWQEGHAV